MSQVFRYRPYNNTLRERAREMRNHPTQAEDKLWKEVLRPLPLRFLRQRIIGHYIVDFYCADLRLVIEVDGDSHFTPEGKAYDLERTGFLNSQGIQVLRFTNLEVLTSIEAVHQSIIQHISHNKKVPQR